MRALFDACVELLPAHYTEKKKNGNQVCYYEIRNNSDLFFELQLKEGNGTKRIVLYPRSAQLLSAPAGTASLTYDVTSTYVRSDQHLTVELPLQKM